MTNTVKAIRDMVADFEHGLEVMDVAEGDGVWVKDGHKEPAKLTFNHFMFGRTIDGKVDDDELVRRMAHALEHYRRSSRGNLVVWRQRPDWKGDFVNEKVRTLVATVIICDRKKERTP